MSARHMGEWWHLCMVDLSAYGIGLHELEHTTLAYAV
jgi:hypothetical protein